MIYENVTQLIGSTPLLFLKKYCNNNDLKSKIFAKLEYFNPSGSAKDRAALKMVEDAEAKGVIKEGSVIIEPTSGNTGIALASIGASRGYKVIMVMPETMSIERRKILKAYGAEIVLTEGNKGMSGAVEKAKELTQKYENSFMPSQFTNNANSDSHFETTGPEIWEQTYGKVDFFISTVGSGGTMTGTSRYLKQKNPNIKIIAVEPASSPVLSGGKAASHKIQGIGAEFIPEVLDTKIYDEIITVKDEEAFEFTKKLAKTEGVLCGISSGAALFAATEIAKKYDNKNIVVILPDTGERYISTELF